jgi:RHS Repeat
MVQAVEALAPVPAGVSCSPELKPGCRALRFKYEATNGRLNTVNLNAYDPSSKTMKEIAVAAYKYDSNGRLSSEWDPRDPGKVTSYGYDAEGHLTALTEPGQESWAFTYGTLANDAGTGRLLKVTRAPATAELWKGGLPENSEAPKVTGTAQVGVKLAASNGKWLNSPIVYGYVWQDCNTSGGACVTIQGATNANYTPTAKDVGHTLRVQVNATNGGGSQSATSAATMVVVGRSYTQTVDSGNSVNAVSCVPGATTCVVSDSKGNAFYATNVSTSAQATWSSWNGPGTSPSQAVDCPTSTLCLLASGNKSGGGTLYYATSLGGAWTLAVNPSYGVDAISCSSSTLCVEGQDGFGYFRYSTNPASTSWILKSQGSAAMKGVFCLSTAFCAIADGAGSVHVATTTAQTESSSWTATDVDGTAALNGVACTTTTSCVAVDGAGNVLDLTIATNGAATATSHNIDGTNSLTAVACTGTTCATVDNKGRVFTSTNSGETWTNRYQPGGTLTSVSCASASLCVTTGTEGKVTAFNPTAGSVQEGESRTPQPGTTVEYGVSLTAGAGLQAMTETDVAKWGQKDDPVEATAILPSDSPQGWPATNFTRATTYYLDAQGRTTNVASPSTASYGTVATTEYNETNDVVRTLSPGNRQTALEAGSKSGEVAKLLDTESTYNGEGAHESETEEPGTRLIEALGPQHEIKYKAGGEQKESLARLHTKYFYDEGAPEGTYDLVTKATTLAQLANEEEVEVRKTTTSYSGQSNLGWKLRAPTSVTSDPEGKKITHTTLYDSATGEVTETRGAAGSGGESAHDAKIVYYSTAANTEGYAACGNHPEWATLVCETLPARQPEASVAPKLPVTMTTYNMWDEPETITETFGTVIRTKKNTYDTAARLSTSETTSSADTALPKVTDTYNAKTGLLEKQSTTVEGKTKTITAVYNTLGQMTEYLDADNNIAKYKYGGPENDGLLEEISDNSDEGKSAQTYSYNPTTKLLEKLTDSAAGTFAANYDTEGKLTSETYPNAMCADYAYNPVGEATRVEYLKTDTCTEHEAPVWFSENRSASVRGEVLSRTSTLANESYTYDSVGRLIEAQETPAGEGCSTRLYTYDDESNRTSQTTRAPGSDGKCANEGGVVLKHNYDEANRLIDSGMAYDSFGNVTKLPAADAEGHELSSTFYVDNAVATQSQNGVTNNYFLDPDGRVRETASAGKTILTHYDGPGEAVAWTSESSEKWTRNIPGIDGTLAAVQTNGEAPVLQLHDLRGNIVATAELNSGATKLLSVYNSTEFGVPNSEKAPPTFAWLGASDIASSLPSGVITYGATSYVPQTGMALQTEQVEPPGAPGGTGAGGAYVWQEDPWVMQGAAAAGAEAPGLEAARERTAAEEAERNAGAYIDPWTHTTMNRTKAADKANELFELEAATVTAYFGLPEEKTFLELAGKLAGEFISQLDDALKWLNDAGNKLRKCAENKRREMDAR